MHLQAIRPVSHAPWVALYWGQNMQTNGAFKCSYAYPGTYGHECGKPATLSGWRASAHTANGIYFAHRCAECSKARGVDNRGIGAWVPLDPEKHANVWS